MRHRRRVRVALSALLGLVSLSLLAGRPIPATGSAPLAAEPASAYVPGEVLVAFKPGPGGVPLSDAAKGSVLRPYGAVRDGTIYGDITAGVSADTMTPGVAAMLKNDVDIVTVPEGQELTVIRALSANPQVRYAEPNYVVHASATPNDPGYTSQWAYTKIQAPAAWDIVTGSTSVTIAIIDTGIDESHPDLAAKIVPGYDYIDNDSNPHDLNGHGTHVAGIAAAVSNNSVGVAGMSWGAKIMPLRVLDADGNGNTADVAAAIGWAEVMGAQIVNLSLGGTSGSQTLLDAVTSAHNAGLLVVAAMGNLNSVAPSYPAAYDQVVMAVSATDQGDLRAPYSNYGSDNDIAAPGGAMTMCHSPLGIYSTLPTYAVTLNSAPTCNYFQQYDFMQGTSQATPFVSGLAALVWSMEPSFTPDQVEQTIETTAVDLGSPGWDQYFGWGRIDALAAVESLLVLSPPTLLPISDPEHDGVYWVDWSDVPNATTYILEEDDNPSFNSPVTRYSGATSTVQLASPLGTWYYRVRAERSGSGNVSAWSNIESLQVVLGTPILQPINNGGAATYQVAWQSVFGATGYRLQESPAADFSIPSTYDVGDVLSYDVTGQPGGTWYYRVQAYTTSGSGDWSTPQSVVVKPAAPTLAAVVPGTAADAYTLSWSSATGATGYRLEESSSATFASTINRYLGIGTTYTVTGQPSGRWYYRVEAYNQAGFSPPSNTRDITVTVPLVPAPQLYPISNTDDDGAYVVQWTAVTTATGYLLEQSRSAYFATTALAYTGTLTQHVVMNQPGGTWYYRVRAVTPSGNSPWSAGQSVFVRALVFLPLIVRN